MLYTSNPAHREPDMLHAPNPAHEELDMLHAANPSTWEDSGAQAQAWPVLYSKLQTV